MFVAIGCSIDGDWVAYRTDDTLSMGRSLDEYVAEAEPGALLWDARWTDERDHAKAAHASFGALGVTESDFGAWLKQNIPGVRIGKVVRSGALPYCEWDTTPEQAAIAKAHREHRRLGLHEEIIDYCKVDLQFTSKALDMAENERNKG